MAGEFGRELFVQLSLVVEGVKNAESAAQIMERIKKSAQDDSSGSISVDMKVPGLDETISRFQSLSNELKPLEGDFQKALSGFQKISETGSTDAMQKAAQQLRDYLSVTEQALPKLNQLASDMVKLGQAQDQLGSVASSGSREGLQDFEARVRDLGKRFPAIAQEVGKGFGDVLDGGGIKRFADVLDDTLSATSSNIRNLSDGIQKGVGDQIQAIAEQAQKAQNLSSSNADLKKSQDDLSRSTQTSSEKLKEEARILEEVSRKADQASSNIAKAGQAGQGGPSKLGASDLVSGSADATRELENITRGVDDASKSLAQSLGDVSNAGKNLGSSEVGNLKSSAEQASQAVSSLGSAQEAASSDSKKLSTNTSQLVREQQRLKNELEKVNTALGKHTKKTKDAENASKGFGAGLKKGVVGADGLAASIGRATSRLGRYLVAAKILFTIGAALREGVRAAVEFDNILREIQGVLPSKSFAEAFAIGEATIKIAKDYGVSIQESAEAAKIFAQAGQDATEVVRSLEAAMTAVRGANLGVNEAQELILAIQKITAGEIEAFEILDRISRVESRRAITASDLSVAVQRVGPVVRQLKGDFAGLIDEIDVAFGATTAIVERTRVTGREAATSLRFILSRLGRPDIVRNLQKLSGVGFARDGGRELRPFVEILNELSVAYNKLQGEGQSAKAFQLLAELGGSRQIQATAAIMEDFATDTLQTARISALAFGDAARRTAIQLDSISSRASKAGTAWTSFAIALGQTAIVQDLTKIALTTLEVLGNAAASGTKGVGELLDLLTGGIFTAGKFKAEFLDLQDIDINDAPKLKDFVKDASDAGISVQQLLESIDTLNKGISQDLSSRFGTFEEIQEKLSSGTAGDSLRELNETFGLELVNGLASIIPRFKELKDNIASASNETDKAKAEALALAEVYTVLGKAVFTSNLLLETNNKAVSDAIDAVGSSLSGKFSEGFDNLKDLDLSSLNVELANTTIQGGNLIALFQGLDNELRPLVGNIFDSAEATNAWKTAIESLNAAGISSPSFGQVLDVFSSEFLSDPDRVTSIIDSLSDSIVELVGANEDLGTSANISTAGFRGYERIQGIIDAAVQSAKEKGADVDALANSLANFEEVLTNSLSNQSQLLNTLDTVLTRVGNNLQELLLTFVTAVDSSNRLEEAYKNLGLGFDGQQSRFQAAKTLFEGLTNLQTELSKQVVLNQTVVDSYEAQTKALEGASLSADEYAEALSRAIVTEENLNEKAAKQAQTIATVKAQVDAYRRAIDTLDDPIGKIFGESDEAQRLFSVLESSLQSVDPGAETVALLTARDLADVIGQGLRLQEEALINRKREQDVLAGNVSLIKNQLTFEKTLLQNRVSTTEELARTRSQLSQGLLTNAGDPIGTLKEQVRLEKELTGIRIQGIRSKTALEVQSARASLALEIDKVRSQGSLISEADKILQIENLRRSTSQDISRLRQEEIAAIIQANQALDARQESQIGSAILESFVALDTQIQNNVDSATSGLRQILSDFKSLEKGGLKTLLSPVADTFISRTVDNFTSQLFDASGTGFFSTVARAFGESTETRLRNNFVDALEQGGITFSDRFLETGFDVAELIRIAMVGVREGESPISGTPSIVGRSNIRGGANLGISALATGAALAFNKQESETAAQTKIQDTRNREMIQQLSVLAGSIGGSVLGGKGEAANIGANIGSLLGETAGTEFGAALGSFAGPVGTIAGGALGGLIGGLFDDEEDKNQTQALNKIEENTRRSVDILELERQANEVARGAINLPSNFSIPAFTPIGAASQVSQTTEISVQVDMTNVTDSTTVVETIRQQLGPMLVEEIRKVGL